MGATKHRPLRKDPRPRASIDGSAIWGQLRDRDPDKHYVYVNKGDPEAMAYYDFAGYDPEVYVKGGVRPAGGRTCREGEVIEMRGLILMSIPRARFLEIEREGPDGSSGQRAVDELEERIIDKNTIFDRQPSAGLQFVNEIEGKTVGVMKDG